MKMGCVVKGHFIEILINLSLDIFMTKTIHQTAFCKAFDVCQLIDGILSFYNPVPPKTKDVLYIWCICM